MDQRGFGNQAIASAGPAYLGAREASALLGVKRATLYAYASRGLVRSEPAPGAKRARVYLREDVERLKIRHDARAGHGPVAAAALRWGEPVLESALTAIDARGPRYRGHLATELAQHLAFESVAELLWTGALTESTPPWPASSPGARLAPMAALVPVGTPIATALGIAVAVLGVTDTARFGAPFGEETARARRLVRYMAALAGLGLGPAHVLAALRERSVARVLLVALGARPTARAERAMNRALVLLADHELNASAFTGRIAASAGADLYACVCAGLATLSGPRHGGMVGRIEALVAEARRPERARSVLHERAERGEEIPGFGHPLYPAGDPRGAMLLDDAAVLAPKNRTIKTLLALAEAMKDAGRPAPTVDVGIVAIASALGLPRGSGVAIFAVGRAAGWIAHVFEQRASGALLRPRARYIGP
jgi:citrate synthase